MLLAAIPAYVQTLHEVIPCLSGRGFQLLSLWSQVSRAEALPGVLSIPEVRGSKQCSAPYVRAQGGTAEVLQAALAWEMFTVVWLI